MTSQPRPPVFVMNPYYTGLGIARSLRDMSVDVYALTSEADAPGVRSRYFRQVYRVPNGREEPEKLRDRLLEIGQGFANRPVLFPTRDFDLLLLDRYRDSLSEAYRLPHSHSSAIARIMDKLELADVARDHGIPTPVTVLATCAAEIGSRASALRFPLIMKPRFAHQWRRSGSWSRVGGAKAILISSTEEALARYAKIAEVTPEVLLQEYVDGDDADITVCCCYIGRQGELIGHFTGRKVKQNPPLVGTGCVVQAADVAAIVPLSVELLRAFGYSGLAEVEFKYDKLLGRYSLIEVNPRHWDQHELGTLVGVNLSWIAYCDIVGMKTSRAAPSYPPGRKCSWIAESELIYAVAQRIMRERSVAAASDGLVELARMLKGRKIFGLTSLKDPIPAVALASRLAADALSLLGKRRHASARALKEQAKSTGRIT